MGEIPRASAIQPSARRAAPPERPPYAAYEVTGEVYAGSYLAPSWFTLTVVLKFATHQMVGFASGQDQWHPVRGTFEVMS